MPNVTGPICDKCLPNFWKIASGIGCESCNCDQIGSSDTQCNLVSHTNATKLSIIFIIRTHFSMMDNVLADLILVVDSVTNVEQTTGVIQKKTIATVCISITKLCNPYKISLFSACECNLQGSETLQCERKTGACICRKGISGHKCDQCTRGYLGEAPYCRPCGECFDNWDRILLGYKSILYLSYFW